jgi:dihydroorotase
LSDDQIGMSNEKKQFDLVLQHGKVFSVGGLIDADIGIRDGRISALGSISGAADRTIDCTGLTVLPGLIDSQVHFREPGPVHKEDLESGSRAAALGGITAFFEMPNTNPLTIDEQAFNDKLDRARGRAWTDYAFYMGGSSANAERLGVLENLPGCCGIKIFMGASTGDLLSADDETIRRIFRNGKRVVAVHAEDNDRLNERKHIAENGADVSLHPEWRDVEVCRRATERVLRLARQTGRRIHVLHITTGQEMALLAENKDIASVEALPQHLTFAAPDCYSELGTRAQMNPPIRGPDQRAALWEALAAGVVDTIGSDHAPHTLGEKAQTYPNSPSGMPGVQTLVPVMLNHVAEGRLTLERLVDLCAYGPARVFRIAAKGRIALGYDADFTLVDLNRTETITDAWSATRSGWTPYDGRKVTGWPVGTILRGHVVMRDGELLGEPVGEPVLFQESIQQQTGYEDD